MDEDRDSDRTMALSRLQAGTETAAALAFFDTLAPVTPEEMVGGWRGSGLPTGHALDGLLELYGWHGKRFGGPDDVHPLVFTRADGSQFCVNPSRLPLGLVLRRPGLLHNRAIARTLRAAAGALSTTRPQAHLRMTEYRGVVTATMIYNRLPIRDAFRTAGPGTLLGAMEMVGTDRPFLFVLRRESAPPPA